MLDVSKRKEDISISYISALCAYTGIAYSIEKHDEDGTDGTLRQTFYLPNNNRYDASLRIQLKCTSSISQYTEYDTYITYSLKAKNYNDLCAKSTTPIILGLLILPENESEWLSWSPEELIIKGCMYWAKFSGETPTKNKNTIDVKISKSNVINIETLQKIMREIAEEEWI